MNGLKVVLVEPEIPQNAGNIARLCAAAGVELHLVRPLGFFLDDKHMRRAGLDYWELVNVAVHDGFDNMVKANQGARLVMATTKAQQSHSSAVYSPDDLLIFGPESRGLAAELLAIPDAVKVRVPMQEGARSLNLANSVSIVVYEALRQLGYPGLSPR